MKYAGQRLVSRRVIAAAKKANARKRHDYKRELLAACETDAQITETVKFFRESLLRRQQARARIRHENYIQGKG